MSSDCVGCIVCQRHIRYHPTECILLRYSRIHYHTYQVAIGDRRSSSHLLYLLIHLAYSFEQFKHRCSFNARCKNGCNMLYLVIIIPIFYSFRFVIFRSVYKYNIVFSGRLSDYFSRFYIE